MKDITHIINLDLAPQERWQFLAQYSNEINELLSYYLNDFEGSDFIFESIGLYKDAFISSENIQEIEYISSISNFTADEVLIANLYYDVLKFHFGCTAFSVFSDNKMLHARNLDWHTENNLLSKYSKIFIFQRNGKTLYKTVGWLGFIGALSGVKPTKFALTLNAILSNDEPQIAKPVSFLLRDILEHSDTFEDAKKTLEETKIASDCLILLSGTKKDEMVVIERTPNRYASRVSDTNFISVTNDYKLLENVTSDQNLLQETSCSRYDRAMELTKITIPKTTEDCMRILADEKVMMSITVQQMVFENITGDIKFKKVKK